MISNIQVITTIDDLVSIFKGEKKMEDKPTCTKDMARNIVDAFVKGTDNKENVLTVWDKIMPNNPVPSKIVASALTFEPRKGEWTMTVEVNYSEKPEDYNRSMEMTVECTLTRIGDNSTITTRLSMRSNAVLDTNATLTSDLDDIFEYHRNMIKAQNKTKSESPTASRNYPF